MGHTVADSAESTKQNIVYNIKSRQGCALFVILIFALIIAVLAYFLGRKNAAKTIDNLVMNNALIQQIAELSSLEVQGNASIKSTNVANDGSFSDELKKLFMEKTINITVPYVAKYGVDLQKQDITIQEKDKLVNIVLPVPKLLSYELKLDRADAITKKGLFEAGNEGAYNEVEKKLYAQSRAQLELNEVYVQQSKEKIKKLLETYYAPMNFKTDIVFKDEIKSKVINYEPQ